MISAGSITDFPYFVQIVRMKNHPFSKLKVYMETLLLYKILLFLRSKKQPQTQSLRLYLFYGAEENALAFI